MYSTGSLISGTLNQILYEKEVFISCNIEYPRKFRHFRIGFDRNISLYLSNYHFGSVQSTILFKDYFERVFFGPKFLPVSVDCSYSRIGWPLSGEQRSKIQVMQSVRFYFGQPPSPEFTLRIQKPFKRWSFEWLSDSNYTKNFIQEWELESFRRTQRSYCLFEATNRSDFYRIDIPWWIERLGHFRTCHT